MSPAFLKPALDRFRPYTPGEQPPDGEGWVKLNTNESPIPPSPHVLEALRTALGASLRLYPSPTAAPAREAIASAHGVGPESVTVGNGGDELIAMCFRAFAPARALVAFPIPTYPLFDPLCAIHEVTPSRHAMGDGWRLPESLAADPAPLKFVVNPNSPTGTWYSAEEVEPILRRSSGVVVVDEAYVDFAPASLLHLTSRHHNLLILRTFSKAYALAGLRIGFGIGHPDLIASLDTVKDSYNLDRLAIVAAVAAVEDRHHHDELVRQVVAERDWLTSQLTALDFEVEPSAANFLFTRPPSNLAAERVVQELRVRRILVRHYSQAPIDGWLRVTVGSRDQHQLLLEALGELVATAR
jgi:histidinol-phosphate aminotransferase